MPTLRPLSRVPGLASRAARAVRPNLGAILCAAFLAACMTDKDTPLQQSRGGGSETTLAGIVRDDSGNPVAGASLRLRAQDDPPPNLFSKDSGEAVAAPLAYTLADGSYRLTGIVEGQWFLECRAGDRRAALLRVETGRGDGKDSLTLPDAILQPTATVRGMVRFADDSGFAADTYVFIPGLWKRTVAKPLEGFAFQLNDIPAGTYTLVVQPAYPATLSRWKISERPITLAPGQTLDLDSVFLAARTGMQDPAYSRDSAAAWAFHLASLDSGAMPRYDWVLAHTAVTGNRITMLYDFDASVFRIPPEVKALDALEVIYVMGLPGPTGKPFTIAPEVSTLPNLRRLWLPLLNLEPLPAWTGTFPALASLDLGSTGLKTFPEWVLGVKNLTTLMLAGHNFTALPKEFTELKKLRALELSGNAFASVPEPLRRMPGLQAVRLRGNRLCDLDAETKAWLSRGDSAWQAQTDPLFPVDTVGWEETQVCGP